MTLDIKSMEEVRHSFPSICLFASRFTKSGSRIQGKTKLYKDGEQYHVITGDKLIVSGPSDKHPVLMESKLMGHLDELLAQGKEEPQDEYLKRRYEILDTMYGFLSKGVNFRMNAVLRKTPKFL